MVYVLYVAIINPVTKWRINVKYVRGLTYKQSVRMFFVRGLAEELKGTRIFIVFSEKGFYSQNKFRHAMNFAL